MDVMEMELMIEVIVDESLVLIPEIGRTG